METVTKRIFMLGIAGSGMRGLAYLLHGQEHTIIGSDDALGNDTEEPTLDFAQIVSAESAAEHLKTCQLLVYSDAVVADHPLRKLAEEMNIVQQGYQTALGEFSRAYKTLAVTGTHGKSTTTAMLAWALEKAMFDPSVLIGASVPAWKGRSAKMGASEFFVVEADEYREHFLALTPAHLIITSIDFDHPDFFASLQAVEESYSKMIAQVKPDGYVVTLKSIYEAHRSVAWPRSENLLLVDDARVNDIELGIAGEHMRQNAALVLALVQKLGVPENSAREFLKTFSGISRRMELLGNIGAMQVFSDYGHHPAEISATLSGMRETYPIQKIIAVFEAHMLERLETFTEEFATSFTKADGVIICPVFMPKGRSVGTTQAQVTLKKTLTDMGKEVISLDSYENLAQTLSNASSKYDIAVAFTAGILDGKLREILKVK